MDKAKELVERFFSRLYHGFVLKTLFEPYFFSALVLTLVLERLIPVDKKQKLFSLSFFQDMIWWLYTTVLELSFIFVYVWMLREAYHTLISETTLHSTVHWPFWVRFVFGILFVDLLFWIQHWINHKGTWFWSMHTVHHSQKELNYFTDFRYHTLEYVARWTVLTVTFLILELNTPTILLYPITIRQYSHFYHGNIKTNLGILKYVLVTPQSHRVHHSVLLQHFDKNFGAIFSIWDFLFGTQYKGFDEYPETGINDDHFPHERSKHPAFLLIMPLVQMYYSLFRVGQTLSRRFSKK